MNQSYWVPRRSILYNSTCIYVRTYVQATSLKQPGYWVPRRSILYNSTCIYRPPLYNNHSTRSQGGNYVYVRIDRWTILATHSHIHSSPVCTKRRHASTHYQYDDGYYIRTYYFNPYKQKHFWTAYAIRTYVRTYVHTVEKHTYLPDTGVHIHTYIRMYVRMYLPSAWSDAVNTWAYHLYEGTYVRSYEVITYVCTCTYIRTYVCMQFFQFSEFQNQHFSVITHN